MNQVEKTAKVLYEGLTGEKWQGLNALQKLDCLIPLEQLVKAERERIAIQLAVAVATGKIDVENMGVYINRLKDGGE